MTKGIKRNVDTYPMPVNSEKFLNYICFLKANLSSSIGNKSSNLKLLEIRSFYNNLELLTIDLNKEDTSLNKKFLSPTPLYEAVEKYFLDEVHTLDIDDDHSDIFELYGKRHDEDFYSDCLSALLNTSNYQEFSRKLLKNICLQINTNYSPSANDYQISRREVFVGEFDRRSNKKLMRMDILISTPRNIFIIEAKTKTKEHDNQTQHYLNAVNKYYKRFERSPKIHAMMLSLDNQVAEDQRYKSLSYKQVYQAIKESLKNHSLSKKQLKEVQIFYFELHKELIQRYQFPIRRAQQYRVKKQGKVNVG